jgi:hypothetical protein
VEVNGAPASGDFGSLSSPMSIPIGTACNTQNLLCSSEDNSVTQINVPACKRSGQATTCSGALCNNHRMVLQVTQLGAADGCNAEGATSIDFSFIHFLVN